MSEQYVGRLGFDPDTETHLSADGQPVVTDDAGATWRYAVDGDPSHNSRYAQRLLVVDTTANQLARTGNVEPHHFEVQPDDPHFNGLVSFPDEVAETATSHTEAYK